MARSVIIADLRMFDTESNELRRVGDGTIPRGRVAYRQRAHFGGHALELLHVLPME